MVSRFSHWVLHNSIRQCKEDKRSAARRGNPLSECEKLFRKHASALFTLSFRNNISHINHSGNSQSLISNNHFTHFTHFKKAAFTLAEVLITLGVIGIVAAMTIPNLVQSYKKKVILTQLKKSYSILQNAIALSEVDNGKFSTWPTGAGMNVYSYFDTYLKPYFRDAKLCYESEDCGYKENMSFGQRRVRSHDSRILFKISDGIIILLLKNTYYSDNSIAYTNDMYIDVNAAKSPNILGEDIFMLQRTPDGIIPYPSENCAVNAEFGCLKKIIENGWEFPEDYPFKF